MPATEGIPPGDGPPKTGAGHGPALDADEQQESTVPSTYQLRQQEQHEKKLEDIREQVASGRLVIRKMTPEERKRFPPRDPSAPSPRARRR
jgi:hypothetical protein